VDGDKLSKLTGAPGIPFDSVSPTLCAALRALRLEPPTNLSTAGLSDVWFWARKTWQMEKLVGCKAIVNTA
jgi:hypothetical protein